MPLGRPLTFAIILLCAAGVSPARAEFGDITLQGFLPLTGTTRITNVWGYYDEATGREYALVGDWFGGFYIVDATDPTNPILVVKVTGVSGFDLKVWDHFVYSCDGNSAGNDTRITSLANPITPVVLPALLPSCHTISISTQGVMYMEYVGVRIFDLNADPQNPDSLYYIDNLGHDSTPRGNRLYDFNAVQMNIWDVSNPSQPALIGSDDDPGVLYYHSGDESKNHNYLYVCDEYAVTPTPDIVIYDINDPSLPVRIGGINDPASRVHQLYVDGDLMFVGYYTAGFKVFDIANPAAPVLADVYDTSPYQTETGPDVYNGAYNAYPYTHSGSVYVADHPSGLFIFSVDGHTGQATGVDGGGPVVARLGQNYPNPFNPATTIEYETLSPTRVVLRVYDVSGGCVRTLVDARQPAGAHRVSWDGRDDAGRAVASGVYYSRLEAGTTRDAKRMVLLK
ncbi:MAG: choice-of-anchor B family protein [Candidatus Krumholzibacteria bacterium]|nr:choice-of-anchor B family protein [Candidatus Krumholzibacteria bacterium]MDH4337036.1 choice-of-anchor B family protein [Candidatus Krumholzibacteria bacterium]MDH5268573.1 choice-of-anchor B family protein [Candidatus Krumholzibacteria bacterium]